MRAIYIPQLLQAPEQMQTVEIQEHLPELETLTPVQGMVKVAHRGNYLEVAGQAETIVTLTCNRCLQQYNYRLQVDTSELIWLRDEPEEFAPDELEREVAYDDLVESLPPQGHFHPGEWLYEQLCLALPPRQLCDAQCPGIDHAAQADQGLVDSRWASLEALKRQLSNN